MRFNYFFSETASNLRRNVLMTLAAISTVAISLLLLGGFEILRMATNNLTLNWEAKVEISAYLRDDAAPGEVNNLEDEVSGYPEVQRVTYVSQAQAYDEFRQLYRNNPEFYEYLDEDSLPASLRIKLSDAKFTEEVAARIEGAPGVDDVRFGGEIIKRLLQVNSLLRTVTFVTSLVLMIAAAALIANTIRLAIYARRDEIGIMKLVGATNWFIRIPFMLEGVIAAMAGALLSGGIVLAANALLFSRMGKAFKFLGPVFTFTSGEMMSVMFVLLGVGALVGLIGSTMALRRFLEV
jgi:cell division transport system permease protein